MAWLISRALMADYENSHSSQVQAGASSGANSSGGEPSVPSSETPTPQAYLSPDKMREFSRPSRSGMMFAPLTESHGEAVLTWCQAGSRVRTSAQQDGGQESKASVPASGVKWRELFKRYDPVSSSWKTHRCLFDADLPASSVILPRWGMMRDGALSERLTLGLRTCERESGLWPTPTAHNAKEFNSPTECQRNAPTLASLVGGVLNPMWVEWLMGWPIGWTDLGPLGTDRFQQWLHSHGGCSTGKPK
jgi:hypothetical protein